MGAAHADLRTRLYRHVLKTENCWLWTGSLDTSGYGLIRIDSHSIRTTHRVSFMLERGAIPAGQLVCHTCDVRNCVNPDHLFLGDHLVNAADMVAKGRQAVGDASSARLYPSRRPRGMRHPKARLTDEQVIAIRAAYSVGGQTYRGLAHQYGVAKGTIQAVLHDVTWRHV